MRRDDMDFSAIVFVIFIAIIVLALLGIVTQRISDKYSISREQSRAKAYATRNDSNTFVLRELAKHGPHEVTLDENAVMTVQPARPAQQAATVAQVVTQPIDNEAHVDAVNLISASIDIVNPDRKPNQLMTADECQAHGILGGDRDRRQRAVKYLCDQFDVMAVSDKGPKNNGVFYTGGTLSKLIAEMAAQSRPRPGSRAAYDESKQNQGTL